MSDNITRTREVSPRNRTAEETVQELVSDFRDDYPDAKVTGIVIREQRNDDGQLLWSVRIDAEA